MAKLRSIIDSIVTATNASKAQVILAINAILGLLSAFHVTLSQTKLAAAGLAANALLALFMSLTYQRSSLRTQAPTPAPAPAPVEKAPASGGP